MCAYCCSLASWATGEERRDEMRWNCATIRWAFARHRYLKNCAKEPMRKSERGVQKAGERIKGFVVALLQQSGSRVFILLLASFSRLTRLFYFCRGPFLLCFSLILFLLLLGIGFGLNLTPFWGYLIFVLCAFIWFIRSFKSSEMRSSGLFAYPLTELLETR
jgi:hypothetical protein